MTDIMNDFSLKNKRVAILINKMATVKTFRMPLINLLKEHGCEVTVISTEPDKNGLAALIGVHFYECKLPNRSTNPFKLIGYSRRVRALLETIRPDVIMTFQLLLNIFGSFGAKKYLKTHPSCLLVSTIEGIGEAFVFRSLKWRILRLIMSVLYKRALRRADLVYFLNPDDMKVFVDERIVCETTCRLINGIGVDLGKFTFNPAEVRPQMTIGMVARLLRLKGIIDYCEFARFLHKRNPSFSAVLIGSESEYVQSDLEEYIADGSVTYLGHVEDMQSAYKSLSFVVLCSLREGCPASIMEAMASGCIPIVNDAPGCRNMVKEEWQNGLLIDTTSKDSYEKIAAFIESVLRGNVGELRARNRELAEQYFDADKIQKSVVNEIGLVLAKKTGNSYEKIHY